MSTAAKDHSGRGARSWRTIRQEVTPHALSRRGRQRRHRGWLKTAALVALVGAGVWGGHFVAHAWADRTALARAVNSPMLAEPVLITDGVLTQKWAREVLALPRSASLMSLDLAALRQRLQAHGQVRTAVLTRSFPDTLVVTLQERTPVARLQLEEGGARRQMLVARDGTVYPGAHYDASMLATLPWLDGFRLQRREAGYAPIAGMEDVARLLTTAQTESAWLYRDWLIVSLARLEEHDEIEVRAEDVPAIVFSRRLDFYKQIARLDFILEEARARTGRAPQRVNLALGSHATVEFDQPASILVSPERSPASFSIQPQQRKGRRDL